MPAWSIVLAMILSTGCISRSTAVEQAEAFFQKRATGLYSVLSAESRFFEGNMDSDDFLVVVQSKSDADHIFRIPWHTDQPVSDVQERQIIETIQRTWFNLNLSRNLQSRIKKDAPAPLALYAFLKSDQWNSLPQKYSTDTTGTAEPVVHLKVYLWIPVINKNRAMIQDVFLRLYDELSDILNVERSEISFYFLMDDVPFFSKGLAMPRSFHPEERDWHMKYPLFTANSSLADLQTLKVEDLRINLGSDRLKPVHNRAIQMLNERIHARNPGIDLRKNYQLERKIDSTNITRVQLSYRSDDIRIASHCLAYNTETDNLAYTDCNEYR